MTIAIIGAGMAGLACAALLAEHGLAPHLFDKSRGVGGRMATRRIPTPAGTATFDHGVPWFSAQDPGFVAALGGWQRASIVAPWPAAGPDAWVGVPTMNSLAKSLAHGMAVSLETHVHSIVRRPTGWFVQSPGTAAGPYEAIAIALPAEQAASLLGMHCLTMGRVAVRATSAPCWTLMCAFSHPHLLPGQAVLRDIGDIALALRNTSKPGRDGPDAWTVHATAAWSERHLEDDKDTVAGLLLDQFLDTMGAERNAVLAHTAHRWRYAIPGAGSQSALWDAALGLGACGDWLVSPTVEGAWLSGRQLARTMLADLRAARPDRAPRRRVG